MKKNIIVTLCLLVATVANAQKLHTIVFGDTNDAKIGAGVQVNVNNFLEYTLDLASELGMEKAYVSPKVFLGGQCNKANLKSAISGFSCSSEDIVIFGYFGHGGRDKSDVSEFPQMCLGSNNPSDFVPLEDVKDALVRKGAHFVFVTGDCCNNYASIGAKRGVLDAQGATVLSTDENEIAKKLFFMEGSVISAGCQKGEYSWVNSLSGGFFTNGYLEEWENYLAEKPANPDWNKLFANVRTNVVNYSREQLRNQGNYVQTPIYQVAKKGEPIIDDGKKKPIVDDGTIRTPLLTLVDKTVSPSVRMSRKTNVMNYFDSNCMVEVVGRNKTTLLDAKNIEEYLGRVSTSPYLNNFVIVNTEKNSAGRITKLVVHEIYVKD